MMQISEEKQNIINQIRKIYSLISKDKDFSKLIPEVRMNISGSLSNAKEKSEIAAIEGRITIINGFPKASGEIKFGVSDHTARLILTAKEFDSSINFVINLKYIPKLIELIKKDTKLELQEIIREHQPENVKKKEYSTMQWLIKESVKKKGKIPDIIWDKGAIGKEPMMRIFAKNSDNLIRKLEQIIKLIKIYKI
ncbi:MAG: thiamine-phosphate synthase family protein [Promethearchaeota archaeon]